MLCSFSTVSNCRLEYYSTSTVIVTPIILKPVDNISNCMLSFCLQLSS